jgi:uncharacterized protein (DUF1778 family)
MPIPTKATRLQFRITEAQSSMLKALAEAEGVRLSEWLRRAAIREAMRLAVGLREDNLPPAV